MRQSAQSSLAPSSHAFFDQSLTGLFRCFRRKLHVDLVGPIDKNLTRVCVDLARLVMKLLVAHAPETLARALVSHRSGRPLSTQSRRQRSAWFGDWQADHFLKANRISRKASSSSRSSISCS